MSARRLTVVVALFVLVGLVAVPVSAGGGHDEERPDIHRQRNALAGAQGQGGENRAPLTKNLSQVGFLPLGDEEVSDVWALGDYAYVGGLGDGGTVKVVDISDPADPQVVEELGAPAGCSPQDVKADRINTKHFRGDLLVVGNDGCFEGLQLYDISDPTNPSLLSEGGPGFCPQHLLVPKREPCVRSAGGSIR